jgi:hypothetical protein
MKYFLCFIFFIIVGSPVYKETGVWTTIVLGIIILSQLFQDSLIDESIKYMKIGNEKFQELFDFQNNYIKTRIDSDKEKSNVKEEGN